MSDGCVHQRTAEALASWGVLVAANSGRAQKRLLFRLHQTQNEVMLKDKFKGCNVLNIEILRQKHHIYIDLIVV